MSKSQFPQIIPDVTENAMRPEKHSSSRRKRDSRDVRDARHSSQEDRDNRDVRDVRATREEQSNLPSRSMIRNSRQSKQESSDEESDDESEEEQPIRQKRNVPPKPASKTMFGDGFQINWTVIAIACIIVAVVILVGYFIMKHYESSKNPAKVNDPQHKSAIRQPNAVAATSTASIANTSTLPPADQTQQIHHNPSNYSVSPNPVQSSNRQPTQSNQQSAKQLSMREELESIKSAYPLKGLDLPAKSSNKSNSSSASSSKSLPKKTGENEDSESKLLKKVNEDLEQIVATGATDAE